MKILCVEDDVFVRMMLQRTFQSQFEVIAVSSGSAAVEELRSQEFAVCVTDLNMPGFSGLELAQFMRDQGIPTQVIVVSGGFADRAVASELRRLGARCLSKPFRTGEIRELVRASLDAYKARQVVAEAGNADDAELVRQVQTLTQQIRSGRDLPSIDTRAVDLVQRCGVRTPEIEELIEIIVGDPALTVQALQLINTAGLGGARRVTDVKEACNRLGAVRLVGLVQELLVKRAICVDRGEWAGVFEDMWKVGRLTAEKASVAAESFSDPSPSEVYVAALLHNVGELLICYDAAIQFEKLTPQVLDAVSRIVASEHEDIGERVLRAWHMPRAVWTVAGEHHGPSNRVAPLLEQRRRVILQSWSEAVAECGMYLPRLAVLAQEPEPEA